MKNVMGFIPAGGKGMRMKPFKLIKELLPVLIQNEGQENEVNLLIENAVNVLHSGGIKNVVCTINFDKEILMKILSDIGGPSSDMKFSFVMQKHLDTEYGLPLGIAAAEPFIRGHTIFMKFPDTIVYPLNCFEELYEFHCEKKSDLTLGVFPTDNSKNLGPVMIDKNHKIIRLEDKPDNPSENNTWNVLIWEDSFLDLLMREVELYRKSHTVKNQELKIYDIMVKAIEENLNVNAYFFEDGKCIDISCVQDATLLWNQYGSKTGHNIVM